VLGLLSEVDKSRIAVHLAGCEVCRRAVMRERRVVRLTQQALADVSPLSPAKLQALRPSASRHQATIQRRRFQFGAAAVSLLLLLFVTGVFFYGNLEGSQTSLPPTTVAQTVTRAHTPTATQVATVAPDTRTSRLVPASIVEVRLPPVAESPVLALTRPPSWSGLN